MKRILSFILRGLLLSFYLVCLFQMLKRSVFWKHPHWTDLIWLAVFAFIYYEVIITMKKGIQLEGDFLWGMKFHPEKPPPRIVIQQQINLEELSGIEVHSWTHGTVFTTANE